MRIIFISCIILTLFSNSFSQELHSKSVSPIFENLPFTSAEIDENTPSWAKEMYSENPNFYKIEREYSKWRLENPNLKNAHTRNFKHIFNYLTSNDGLDKKGRIIPDFEKKIEANNKTWQKQRTYINSLSRNLRNNTNWISIGPEMMYRDGGKANIQANIYAISQCLGRSETLYATTEAGGAVFRSDDKGENWYPTNDEYTFDGPRELEIHPTNPDTVFVSSKSNVYRSYDGGQTWNSVYYNWSSDFYSIIINPVNPDLILAAGDERIIKSVDGGNSWVEVYPGAAYDLKFKPGNASIVYALVDNSTTLQTDFYRSIDSGSTWSKISSGWPNETSTRNRGGRMTVSEGFSNIIYAFIGAEYVGASEPKNGSKVLKSSDAGISWQTVLNYDDLNGVNNGQGFYDWDIEVSDTDTNTVIFGTQGRWLTKDGFATNNWSKSGGELGHADVQEILINGSDIWIANDGGIIKFDDESFDHFEIKMQGINATSYWSFDQGWNRDAQIGSHYHNGTSVRTESYNSGEFLSYGGAEPQFSALKHPYPDKGWSKGYGSVNGKNIPDNINFPVESFKYNITPNAEYGSNTWRESEIEVYPEAYNTHFTGSGNVLYRSDDFGITWDTVNVFGSNDTKVTKIEIPRANTQIMYVACYDPSGYTLYYSLDLGQSFQAILGPASLVSDGIFLTVDQNNENIIWIATYDGNSANNKLFKSIDRGSSWTNLSTDQFDGHSIRAIMSVSGTDGGIYAIARNAVFYRNNILSDWEILISNLPAKVNLRDIKPYYKEGKVRVAGDARGIWSADLYDQPTTIIPQATVNLIHQPCSRDTLLFDDFSIVNHDGASWNWEFNPQPIYVDNKNVRNPKVIFGQAGIYEAIMNLSKDGITYMDTLSIEIDVLCNSEEISGNAFVIDDYNKHATISEIGKSLDAFTFSLWVRPEEIQESTAFMFSANNGLGINYYGSSKNVTIHYPGYSTWAYNPGMEAKANEWTHLALTSDISTEQIILYVNGVPYNYTSANSGYKAKTVEFDKITLGWLDRWWSGRWYEGKIDEFRFYNRALSADEIRLTMHHPVEPDNEPSLIHYYQFNEVPGSGIMFDKISIKHAIGTGLLENSTGPFGPGITQVMNVNSSGTYDFGLPEIMLDLDAQALGKWSASRIYSYPDENPSNHPTNSSYWVIHNYEGGNDLSNINKIIIKDIELYSEAYPSTMFGLHNRINGKDGITWASLDMADASDANLNSLTFESISLNNNFAQLAIDYSGANGWIGVKNTEWNDPENWGAGLIPIATDHVIIPPNTPFQPEVNISGEVLSLKLMENAIIRVLSGNTFKVKS